MLLAGGAFAGAPENRSELANMVIQDCGSCHGLTMRGGLGPPLRPDDLKQQSVESIAAIIREGLDGTAMPPWKPLLTDEQILWISRQLKSGALLTDETKDAR
jgi:cytochrome c55X